MVSLMLFSITFSDFSLCCWCFAKIGSAALQEEIDHTVQTVQTKCVAFAQGARMERKEEEARMHFWAI